MWIHMCMMHKVYHCSESLYVLFVYACTMLSSCKCGFLVLGIFLMIRNADKLLFLRLLIVLYVLQAKDRGSPSRSSVVLVTVEVTDVNDNKPVFSRDVYEVNFTSTQMSGLCQVRRSDTCSVTLCLDKLQK